MYDIMARFHLRSSLFISRRAGCSSCATQPLPQPSTTDHRSGSCGDDIEQQQRCSLRRLKTQKPSLELPPRNWLPVYCSTIRGIAASQPSQLYIRTYSYDACLYLCSLYPYSNDGFTFSTTIYCNFPENSTGVRLSESPKCGAITAVLLFCCTCVPVRNTCTLVARGRDTCRLS